MGLHIPSSRSFLIRNILILIIWLCVVVAVIVPSHLGKAGHNPPIGVYIAVMGLATAVATFRGDILTREKIAWIFLITVLMVAEVRNLYIADADQLERFRKISEALDVTRKGLEATASGIENTAAKLDVVTANIRRSQGQITVVARTLSTLREEDRRRAEQLQQSQLFSMSSAELATSAREIAGQMTNYQTSYSLNDSQIDLEYYDILEGPGSRWTKKEQDDWIAEEQRKRSELRTRYEDQAVKLISDANRIRAEIVKRLAFSGDHIAEDDLAAKWFNDPRYDKRPFTFLYSLGEKGAYLGRVASRLLAQQQ